MICRGKWVDISIILYGELKKKDEESLDKRGKEKL